MKKGSAFDFRNRLLQARLTLLKLGVPYKGLHKGEIYQLLEERGFVWDHIQAKWVEDKDLTRS